MKNYIFYVCCLSNVQENSDNCQKIVIFMILMVVFSLAAQLMPQNVYKLNLSYDVASGSEITPCNKIDKHIVVYRFTGNVMTSITTLRI